jgi:hypothetical protein
MLPVSLDIVEFFLVVLVLELRELPLLVRQVLYHLNHVVVLFIGYF